MKTNKKLAAYLMVVTCVTAGSVSAQDGFYAQKNSDEYKKSLPQELKVLEEKKFQEDLMSPGLGAATENDFSNAKQAIVSTWNTLQTERGSSTIVYDVILQAGHYKRKPPGKTGTAGKDVSEQQLVAYLVKQIKAELSKSTKLKVLALSADEYAPGLHSKIFLSVHADGSNDPCNTGPSLSYQKNSSTLAMHAIGWGLSQAIGYDYGDFRKDGFTADAAHYYMFSKVDAPVMKGLLEVGELTCGPSEKRLILSADSSALNLARAIEFILDTSRPSVASK